VWITLDDDIRSFDCNVLDISKGGGSDSPNTQKRSRHCGLSSRVSGQATWRSIGQRETERKRFE
jgi:hypothetical protein